MDYFKVFDKEIYGYEMDFHGFYHPARALRMVNNGFIDSVGKQGLQLLDLKKINATQLMGMLDLRILEDVSVRSGHQSASVYARPLERTRSILTNRVYLAIDDRPIVTLDGVIMIVDMDTHKVIPTRELEERLGIQLAPPLPAGPARLELPEDMELAMEITVRHCECDINRHLNVARYVDYICEVVGYWTGPRKRLSRLKIELNQECCPGDVIGVYVKQGEAGCFVKGVKQTGTAAFKAYCEMIVV